MPLFTLDQRCCNLSAVDSLYTCTILRTSVKRKLTLLLLALVALLVSVVPLANSPSVFALHNSTVADTTAGLATSYPLRIAWSATRETTNRRCRSCKDLCDATRNRQHCPLSEHCHPPPVFTPRRPRHLGVLGAVVDRAFGARLLEVEHAHPQMRSWVDSDLEFGESADNDLRATGQTLI